MLRMLHQIKHTWKEDEEFRALVHILNVLLLCSTILYSLVENWSIVNSIYFCIMTISTVGYGDFTPTTEFSKIYTVLFSILGIGIFVGIVSKLAKAFTNKRLEKIHVKSKKNVSTK